MSITPFLHGERFDAESDATSSVSLLRLPKLLCGSAIVMTMSNKPSPRRSKPLSGRAVNAIRISSANRS
jgi:hypothetical protein